MNSVVFELVSGVIERSSREQPADAVLRASLRAAQGLEPEDSAAVCEAVNAYYRWFGWLRPEDRMRRKIQDALDLDHRFHVNRNAFTDLEYRTRCVPDWVAAEMDVTAAWAKSLQRDTRLWLRAKPGQAATLAECLGDCAAPVSAPRLDALVYLGMRDLFQTPEFHRGEFEIQDLSSQCVGLMCDPAPGSKWWDACAGEGGKTLHLGALMQNKGLIVASDRAAWRLEKLKRRTARAQMFNYRPAQWNGGVKLPFKTLFDGVLVDAPCSGIGTWQRNPQARWTTTAQDVAELAQCQFDLLDHAAKAVKPGGKLVYSVCTLARKETEQVADAFGKGHPEFHPLVVAHPLKPTAALAARHWFRPEDHGANGMFVALWRRAGGQTE
jgi:16S rRNA (cytosine967-C5)-methyltransferase